MASGMDRETKDQYLVIIQAKDMVGQAGALSATATVTINLSDINDNPPKFQQRKYRLLIIAEVLKFRSSVALLSDRSFHNRIGVVCLVGWLVEGFFCLVGLVSAYGFKDGKQRKGNLSLQKTSDLLALLLGFGEKRLAKLLFLEFALPKTKILAMGYLVPFFFIFFFSPLLLFFADWYCKLFGK